MENISGRTFHEHLGTAGRSRKGFTLVEIMIVVVIIGLLASIAIPAFQKARQQSQATAIAQSFRVVRDAVQIYSLDNGVWPEDVSQGILPVELSGYMSAEVFSDSPIANSDLDYEGPDRWGFAAVSLRGTFEDDQMMMIVDRQLDDGNLATGSFQKGLPSEGTYGLRID